MFKMLAHRTVSAIRVLLVACIAIQIEPPPTVGAAGRSMSVEERRMAQLNSNALMLRLDWALSTHGPFNAARHRAAAALMPETAKALGIDEAIARWRSATTEAKRQTEYAALHPLMTQGVASIEAAHFFPILVHAYSLIIETLTLHPAVGEIFLLRTLKSGLKSTWAANLKDFQQKHPKFMNTRGAWIRAKEERELFKAILADITQQHGHIAERALVELINVLFVELQKIPAPQRHFIGLKAGHQELLNNPAQLELDSFLETEANPVLQAFGRATAAAIWKIETTHMQFLNHFFDTLEWTPMRDDTDNADRHGQFRLTPQETRARGVNLRPDDKPLAGDQLNRLANELHTRLHEASIVGNRMTHPADQRFLSIPQIRVAFECFVAALQAYGDLRIYINVSGQIRLALVMERLQPGASIYLTDLFDTFSKAVVEQWIAEKFNTAPVTFWWARLYTDVVDLRRGVVEIAPAGVINAHFTGDRGPVHLQSWWSQYFGKAPSLRNLHALFSGLHGHEVLSLLTGYVYAKNPLRWTKNQPLKEEPAALFPRHKIQRIIRDIIAAHDEGYDLHGPAVLNSRELNETRLYTACLALTEGLDGSVDDIFFYWNRLLEEAGLDAADLASRSPYQTFEKFHGVNEEDDGNERFTWDALQRPARRRHYGSPTKTLEFSDLLSLPLHSYSPEPLTAAQHSVLSEHFPDRRFVVEPEFIAWFTARGQYLSFYRSVVWLKVFFRQWCRQLASEGSPIHGDLLNLFDTLGAMRKEFTIAVDNRPLSDKVVIELADRKNITIMLRREA